MDLQQCDTESDESQKQGSWTAAAEIRRFVWLWTQTGAALSLLFSADLAAKHFKGICFKW